MQEEWENKWIVFLYVLLEYELTCGDLHLENL